MKTIYFDCETTGLDPIRNDIIQFAGIITDSKNKPVEEFNYKMMPTNWKNIDDDAIKVHGMDLDTLKGFPQADRTYEKIVLMFDKYINRYDREDKFTVCGYNVSFDISFLNKFFEKNGNSYLFSYMDPKSVKDPLHVIRYLKALGKIDIVSAKLTDVCEYLNIKLDMAHDALADIRATMAVIERVDKLLLQVKI